MKCLSFLVFSALVASVWSSPVSAQENIDDELVNLFLDSAIPAATICCKVKSTRAVVDENGEPVKDAEGNIKAETFSYYALITEPAGLHSANRTCRGGDGSQGSSGVPTDPDKCKDLVGANGNQ